MVVFGKNIQNADITKNNNDNEKKTFRKNKGLSVSALCSLVSLSIKYGHSFDIYLATPVDLLYVP